MGVDSTVKIVLIANGNSTPDIKMVLINFLFVPRDERIRILQNEHDLCIESKRRRTRKEKIFKLRSSIP